MERNPAYSLEGYEKAAAYGNDSYACRQSGFMDFTGYGTAVDYARYDLLRFCYLLGYGCQQNPAWGKPRCCLKSDLKSHFRKCV